ncbi:MAG: NEAT domain-containing protein [Clostridium sp.]|uniref:NEAT domain-containing protein n=1 Tax=Intestinibacter sp. TaxID=1965304 RepID=UPI0025FA233D|nr:NEAT domain-containing protein [uncultured Intestinibacter sp.]
MIFKNKKVKTAMAALAILTIFGGSISSSYAAELTNAQSAVVASQQRIDLDTTFKKDNSDEASSANSYLQDSYLKVENGKRYMVLELGSGDLMKSVVPTINGQEIKYENELNESTKVRTITFEISSLNDDIRIKFQINPFGNFIVNATARVDAKISTGSTEDKDDTVTSPTQKPQQPEQQPEQKPEEDKDNKDDKEDKDDKEEDKDDKNDNVDNGNNGNNNGNNSNGSTSDKNDNNSSNGTYKNGHYQVKNVVILDNPVGYSMVRGILNETSNVEIKDGKYYLTLEIGQSSLMKNIVIKANSKTLSYTKTNVGNDTIRIKVEIPSLSTKLNISTYVDAMSKTVDFDVKLNESTLKFVSANQEGQLPENNNQGTIPGGGNTGGGSNDSNSGSNDTVVGDTATKGKLYTIQNKVVHQNETGREMARKYLNQTSKVEDIDGQLYLTLTFTGTNLMNNHKFYVNGSLVSHQVTASSSTSKSYRFKISSLKDDIKVSAYIIPMSRSVEFGVQLLESTYTFVKDIDGSGSSLPQTGSVINAESMLAGGSLITALGAFIGRRKRK